VRIERKKRKKKQRGGKFLEKRREVGERVKGRSKEPREGGLGGKGVGGPV